MFKKRYRGRKPAKEAVKLWRFTRPQWAAIWLLLCCQSLMILDTSAVNVALVAIGRDFAIPIDQIGSINLGFVVAVASMIPLSGWAGERFGTVRVLAGCLGVVVIGSLICAISTSLSMIVTGRIIQGAGSGGLVPLASSLLFRNFVPMQRLRVMAALSLPIAAAPALGPFIGGLLVDALSWRWVFLLNFPLSIIAIVIAIFFAKEIKNRASRPLDLKGAVLTLIGFATVVFGVERLATGADLFSGATSLTIGIIALLTLVPLQIKKGPDAFLSVHLFKRKVFAKTISITAAHSMGFMGLSLAGPLLLQTQLGISAFEAGLVGVTGALGPMLSGRIARRIIVRLGPRPVIAISQTSILIGLGVMLLGYQSTTLWIIIVGVFICGAASLLTIMACQTVGFAAVPPRHLGDATTLDGTSRQVGNAVGIASVSGALALAGALGGTLLLSVGITIATLALFHISALMILANSIRLPLPAE